MTTMTQHRRTSGRLQTGAPLKASACFEANAAGTAAAQAEVSAQVVRWGLAPLASRAAAIAAILTAWLADNDPGSERVEVLICQEDDELEVCVRDRGTMLPALGAYDQLVSALSRRGLRSFGAARGPKGGRVLYCGIALDCTWRAAYTWRVAAGTNHPEHSVEGWPSAQQAEQAVRWMLRTVPPNGIELVAAHLEGPCGEYIPLHPRPEAS